MPEVGRNEPCPCKSGKKYKHCHWNAERGGLSESSRAMRLHELDQELVERLAHFASREFGRKWLGELLAELGIEELDESIAQLVFPCAVYEWASEDGTALDIFLDSSPRLSERERGWLEAQTRAWLSVWEIQDVTPGVALSVRDLFTGEERRVLEQAGSRTLSPRDSVLGRIVDFEGISVFCGMHPRVLPPRPAAALVAALRKTSGFRSKKVAVSRLRASVPLEGWFLTWEQFVEHHDTSMAKMPELQNTDGDPLLLTNERYEFDPNHRREIEAELAKLAEDDDATSAGERSFTFSRAGNAMHKSWDNTIVGRAVLRERVLVLETNSVRRADDLRTKVEATLGTLVRHRARDHQDPHAMLQAGRDPRTTRTAIERAAPPSPEETEVLRAFKQQHFESWLDTPIPALSGLTPREAAAKPRKREQVVLLLKEIENRESRVPPAERFDVSTLWGALHLHEAGP